VSNVRRSSPCQFALADEPFHSWGSAGAGSCAAWARAWPSRSQGAEVDSNLTSVATRYYGQNLTQLAQVKRTWDPDNVFDFPQAVPSNGSS